MRYHNITFQPHQLSTGETIAPAGTYQPHFHPQGILRVYVGPQILVQRADYRPHTVYEAQAGDIVIVPPAVAALGVRVWDAHGARLATVSPTGFVRSEDGRVIASSDEMAISPSAAPTAEPNPRARFQHQIVNACPHPLTFTTVSGDRWSPTESITPVRAELVDGQYVLTGLPRSIDGTVYVVPALVAALADRPDFMSPGLVRDGAADGLVCYSLWDGHPAPGAG